MSKFPKDWDIKELNEVASVQTGLAKGKNGIKDPVTLPYLRVANVQDGFLDLTHLKTIQVARAEVARYSLKPNDVVLTEGGDLDKLGRGYVWKGQVEPCLHQNHIFVVRTDKNKLRARFLAALTSSPYGRKYFLACAKRTTNLASINSTQLKEFPVLLPPVKEQDHLLQILNCWDTTIETTEKLIAAKIKLKKALMQQLLTGKKRLPDFAGQEWKEVRLGEVFREIKDTNDGGDSHSIMTISSRLGLISQQDKFDRVIAGDSLIKYTQLKREDFAYNKGNSKSYQMGCIYQLEGKESALVPFVYICFSPTDAVCSTFYKYWFLAHGLDRQLKKIITSGARGDGLLNVNTDDFFKLKVPFPPKDEQIAIAQVFQALSKEMELLEKQRAALKTQKRGLMQQLLTGKRRIKVDNQVLNKATSDQGYESKHA